MLIEGKSREGGAALAKYLQEEKNEGAKVLDIRYAGIQPTLEEALHDWDTIGRASNTEKYLYHLSLNPAHDEQLRPDQLERSLTLLDKELGFENQPRAVIMHEKDGLQHYHVVWLRIDCESKNLRAIPDSHNYRKHEIVARQLEREYGWKHVQGAHIEREGKARPERTPSRRELYQAERTGIKPKDAKALVTELWRGSKTGVEFEIALEGAGWRLAQGDRRDYVLIDPKGGTHSLARRIEGAKAADLRERLDPIKEWLPSVADAKAVAREGDRRHTWAERAVIEARDNTRTGGDFLAEIGEAGITLARVTAQDIAVLKAEQALAVTRGEAVPYVPPIIEGDLAAITTTGKILPLSALRLGSAAEYEQRLAADGFPLPSAIEARDSALAIHEGKQQARGERQQAWEARQIEWATPNPGGLTPTDVATEIVSAASQTLDTLDVNEHGLLKTAEAALDKVTDVLESFFAPEPPKPEKVKQQEIAHEQQRAATHDQAAKKARDDEKERKIKAVLQSYGFYDETITAEEHERRQRIEKDPDRGLSR